MHAEGVPEKEIVAMERPERRYVITVKKRAPRRLLNRRPIEAIEVTSESDTPPTSDTSPAYPVPTHSEQEETGEGNELLIDVLSDLIVNQEDWQSDGRKGEQDDGQEECATGNAPNAYVPLDDGEGSGNSLLYMVLSNLVIPDWDKPMSDQLKEILLDLLPDNKTRHVPHRKHEGEHTAPVTQRRIRIGKQGATEDTTKSVANEVHHVEVKTRKLKKKRRRRLVDILPKLGLIISLCIFAYPVLMDSYKQWLYSQTISEGMSYDWESAEFQEILEQAHLYNQMISGTLPSDVDVDSIWPYEKQLNYGSGGMMAWVEIPDLRLKLPIYHGSSDEALMAGVGHMERTSLPVGGDHTKCALSGHTGMHNERMFDSLDDLEEGDIVIIHALGNDLYYSVTYKEVVEPDALDKLYIDCEDSQIVLITCTPRGINSHRLLVHATQVDAESTQIENDPLKAALNYLLSPTVIALTAFLLVLLVLLIIWLIRRRRRRGETVATEEMVGHNRLSVRLFGSQHGNQSVRKRRGTQKEPR